MNLTIDTTTPRGRARGLRGLAGLAFALVTACGGTTGFDNPPPPTVNMDASVAPPVMDASPIVQPMDATVTDAGGDAAADDDSVIERPPPQDTGVPLGSTMDSGSTDAAPSSSNGRAVTTASIFGALGPDCLWCTTMNGCFDPTQLGGTCEDAQKNGFGCGVGSNVADSGASGNVAGGGAADGGDGGGTSGFSAGTYFAPTNPTGTIKCYSDICTKTLDDIFASQCAASLQETPCLCGTSDAGDCLSGKVLPMGPVLPDYEIDFPMVTPGVLTESLTIQMWFTNQSYGAGQANSLVQCSAAFGCNTCFGGPLDGGSQTATPDSGGALTQAILSAQSSDCLSCAQSSGCLNPQIGGSCEDTPGMATLSGQTLSDGRTCAGLFGSSTPSETQVCLSTLQAIFASGCQPTPQDPVTFCLSSGVGIPATLSDDYTCEFGQSGPGLQQQGGPLTFVDQSLGAGRANALAQCLGANSCNSCFHPAPEAGAPEAGPGADH